VTTWFQAELERFLPRPGAPPKALARFHDGECKILEGKPYEAKSGWTTYGNCWLRSRLEQSLRADLDGYFVGISPPCDWPEGTAVMLPMTAGKHRCTFATIFWHANYPRVQHELEKGSLRGAAVVSSSGGHYTVPARGAVEPWDIDALVTELLDEERTILVSAGPCACIIVHQYWLRCPPERRQTILDIGSAVDYLTKPGEATRHYAEANSPYRNHHCSWNQSAPWGRKKGKRKPRGWKGHLWKNAKQNPGQGSS